VVSGRPDAVSAAGAEVPSSQVKGILLTRRCGGMGAAEALAAGAASPAATSELAVLRQSAKLAGATASARVDSDGNGGLVAGSVPVPGDIGGNGVNGFMG